MKNLRTLAFCTAVLQAACRLGVDTPQQEEGLTLSVYMDTVEFSTSPSVAAADLSLASDLRITDVTFPQDVTALPDGSVAVLDRMEAGVALFDSAGVRKGFLGRRGAGPGEFESPYAIAALGWHLAVWDSNGRLTVMRRDGSVAGITSSVRGDVNALTQRLSTSLWEEPFQVSREDVTRRLGIAGDAFFGLLIQADDERQWDEFMEGSDSRQIPHALVRIDTSGSVVDTVLRMRGQDLSVAMRASSLMPGMARERPFASRPMWAGGGGWIAWAHGDSAMVRVAFADGRQLTLIWPPDDGGFSAADFDAFIDWEIEGYQRTKGVKAATEAAAIPADYWRAEVAAHQGSGLRPQLMGLIGGGDCLGLLGLRPPEGPHGEATTAVIVNVREPSRFAVVAVQSEPGFLRGIEGGALYYIGVESDGARVVERYRLPVGVCSG